MTTILIIDDDPTQRLVASSVIRKAGHEVLQAGNGKQGLGLARLYKPDLIVCDVQMPGMSGFELVEALRSDAELAETPVIMLTALGQRAHVRIGMTAGADDYIAKPFLAVELLDAVAALLSRRKMRQERQLASVEGELTETLAKQKQLLALQYEKRLAEELNQRWSEEGDRNTDLHYDQAVVLAVNLFSFIVAQSESDPARVGTLRQMHQRARDVLYLFGARHLLPFGNDLLAIFAGDSEQGFQNLQLQAIRAGFALRKAAGDVIKASSFAVAARKAAQPPISIALACGPLVLSQFTDVLHGEETSLLASGEAIRAVQSLQGWAQKAGWAVAGLPCVIDGLADMVSIGRSAVIEQGALGAPLDAMELLSLAT